MASKPCAVHGCPNLKPCGTHPERPRNAPWSKDRDHKAQARFRTQVLTRDNHTCTRCGHHDPTGRTLQAHHIRPGYDQTAGTTLCTSAANDCHHAVDTSAR